jgi:hypothetical protein
VVVHRLESLNKRSGQRSRITMAEQTTVGELLDRLSKLPRDMLVLVDGYENGYDHPEITMEMVIEVGKKRYYDGQFQNFKQEGGPVMGYVNAIVIGRDKNPD